MKIFFVLNGENRGPYKALFVGGCVRNAILGTEITDIDFATQLNPAQVIDILSKNKIKTIKTGIEHGTVTAIHNGSQVEITTLRQDIAPDGRRSDVAYTQDWALDAQRRDFTINTLLADDKGHVYDPLGVGLDDLDKCLVRFVGDPTQRICEDYLRILRFFRFLGYYGEDEPSKPDLKACAAHSKHLKKLSIERITQEMLKIMLAPKATNVLSLMKKNNILPELLSHYNHDIFELFASYQSTHNKINAITRLRALKCETHHIFDNVRLSKKQCDEISSFDKALAKLQNLKNIGLNDLLKIAYYKSCESTLQAAFLLMAENKIKIDVKDIAKLAQWQRPSFPLSGNALRQHGYKEGKELGETLKKVEKWWVDNAFKPSHDECLRYINDKLH